MTKILFFLLLMLLPYSASSETKTEGKNSPIVQDISGNVTIIYKSMGLSLQAHEGLLRKEIEKTEIELRKLADKKTKKLIDKLSTLRKELDLILDEKNRLAKMVYEYRQQIKLLNKAKVKAKNTNSDLVSDIEIIDSSKDNTTKLMSNIKTNKDKERLLSLLDILIADTESMEKDERQYWRDILPSMTFKQTYNLLKILVTERLALVELEKKYLKEIKSLVKKGSMRKYEEQKKKVEKNGDIKEIELINIKKYVVYKPDINDLREAERKTKELISINNDYLDAYMFLIEILNKYKEDRSYDIKLLIESIQDRFKSSSDLNKPLGYAYLNMKERKMAYKYINKVATSSEKIDDSRLLALYASLSLDYGDTKDAQKILERNYEDHKEKSLFVANYAYILDENGQQEKAQDILERYLTFNKNTVIILRALAFKYYGKNNYKKALLFFKRAHHKNKRAPGLPLMAALSTVELGRDMKKSLELIELSKMALDQQNNPNDGDIGEIYLALSIISLEMGKAEGVAALSNGAVNNTYGCSIGYMKKLNWHKKMLFLLEKYRLSIGCP